MGRVHPAVDDRLAAWLQAQPVFFVASAPLERDGLVNCSPKGNRGEFVVLGPTTVGYLDQTGSGVETVAHVRENGRLVLMFCAFEGPPRIVRLHGRARVVATGDSDFAAMAAHFPSPPATGARAVIVLEVSRVADSCGYGVPLMAFARHRSAMDEWAARKGPAGLLAYQEEHNARSLDGLPGLAAGGQMPASASSDETT